MKLKYNIWKEIYDEKNIKKILKVFSLFNIIFDDWILEIEWNSKKEIDEIFNEFLNYYIYNYCNK
ncbi:MAG: hypothetical protein ACD_4C00136G0020 [uncultured bacterium (gcode 4)]|uniref:Uncharacterized protein n=1 Tax=uncultured bacterium (gcode 4) TaxID=1234023 RepID=K2GU33_9BACT|nr:MAG: hypothetical protein ACD_4C00136G0020 [uncultured bacterium (gcode 4)]